MVKAKPGEIIFAGSPEEAAAISKAIREKNMVTGGPSSYYDFPFQDWTTTNDMVDTRQKISGVPFALSFKDIFKALCRWGDKDGTSYEYDAKKIIYYGCRILRKVVGNDGLTRLLAEPIRR